MIFGFDSIPGIFILNTSLNIETVISSLDSSLDIRTQDLRVSVPVSISSLRFQKYQFKSQFQDLVIHFFAQTLHPIIGRNWNFVEYFLNFTTFPFSYIYFFYNILLTNAQNTGFIISHVLLTLFRLFVQDKSITKYFRF